MSAVQWRGCPLAPSAGTARYCKAGEGAAPGWGTKLDAAPHSGLARPDLITKPAPILCASGQATVSRGMSAPALSRFFTGSMSLLRLLRKAGRLSSIGREAQLTAPRPWLHSAWNESGPVHVSVSGVTKGRCMVPPLGGLLD